jgi:hypothetical protein
MAGQQGLSLNGTSGTASKRQPPSAQQWISTHDRISQRKEPSDASSSNCLLSLSLSGCAAWWGDGGRAWADAQISQRDAPLITYNQTEIFGAPGDAGNVTVDEAHP